jgi:hypothetical protein
MSAIPFLATQSQFCISLVTVNYLLNADHAYPESNGTVCNLAIRFADVQQRPGENVLVHCDAQQSDLINDSTPNVRCIYAIAVSRGDSVPEALD